MKLYLPCGRYLFPPRRGPLMGTARTPTTDQSNWMTRMQSRKLHEVTLPGSHHTGKFLKIVMFELSLRSLAFKTIKADAERS